MQESIFRFLVKSNNSTPFTGGKSSIYFNSSSLFSQYPFPCPLSHFSHFPGFFPCFSPVFSLCFQFIPFFAPCRTFVHVAQLSEASAPAISVNHCVARVLSMVNMTFFSFSSFRRKTGRPILIFRFCFVPFSSPAFFLAPIFSFSYSHFDDYVL